MLRILGLCLILAAVTFFPRTTQAAYCADARNACAATVPPACTGCGACAAMYGFTGTCSCNIYPPNTFCSCN